MKFLVPLALCELTLLCPHPSERDSASQFKEPLLLKLCAAPRDETGTLAHVSVPAVSSCFRNSLEAASCHYSPSTEVEPPTVFPCVWHEFSSLDFLSKTLIRTQAISGNASRPQSAAHSHVAQGPGSTLKRHRARGLPAHCSLLPAPTSSSPSCPAQSADTAVLRVTA